MAFVYTRRGAGYREKVRRENEPMSESGRPHDDSHDHDGAPHDPQVEAVNRSHNRDTLSSEAMTEMLRDLQDSMLALDERVSGLEAARESAGAETRVLALNVVEMGDALARRVRALEKGEPAPAPPPLFAAPTPRPAKRPPERTAAWVVGLAVLLLGVLGLLWMLRTEALDRAASAPRPAPPAVHPAAPVPVPPAAAPPVAAPTPPASKPFHHWTGLRHTQSAAAPPATSPDASVPYKSLTNSTP